MSRSGQTKILSSFKRRIVLTPWVSSGVVHDEGAKLLQNRCAVISFTSISGSVKLVIVTFK